MKKIILAAAIAALASMSVAAFASAGVDRYQVATGLTMTATFNGTTYVHTYTLDTNCDGSFTGTGGIASLPQARPSADRSPARTSPSTGRTWATTTPATPGTTTAR